MTKKLKIAALVFALTFIVGAAFAATNGVLAFGGTVRINSAAAADMRMDIIYTSIEGGCIHNEPCSSFTYEIITENGRTFISFDYAVEKKCGSGVLRLTPPRCREITFTYAVENTGTASVRYLGAIQNSDGTFPIRHSLRRISEGSLRDNPIIRPGQRLVGQLVFHNADFHNYLSTQNEYIFNVRIEIPYELAE